MNRFQRTRWALKIVKKNIPTIYVPDFLFATIRNEIIECRKLTVRTAPPTQLVGARSYRDAFFLKCTRYF